MTENYHQNMSAWHKKTNARLLTLTEFLSLKSEKMLHIVGVVGFTRSWQKIGGKNQDANQLMAAARQVIQTELTLRQQRYEPRLVMCSGATDAGVLQLAYQEAAKLGITAMGVTPDRTLQYNVGEMSYLIPFGHEFGDESEAFLQVIDELILMGGGPQSRTETLAAIKLGKPVTIIQGFGGAADEFSPAMLPSARFVPGPNSRGGGYP